MSLHDRIMNIPEGNDDGLLRGEDRYWIGFVNGKHQAAQIAKEADELMAEMGNALARIDPDDLPRRLKGRVAIAINHYNAWKESTK